MQKTSSLRKETERECQKIVWQIVLKIVDEKTS